MAAINETGHAKNVANFSDLISFVTSYGARYNPTKASLKLASLNTLNTAANDALTDVTNKNTAFNNETNNRALAFSTIKSQSTRMINALQSTDAIPAKINDAKAFNRKIQGQRAQSSKVVTVDANTPAPASISVSQRSYDQLIQHFTGLVSILQSEPSYAPNEPDLKIAALTTQLAGLKNSNKLVDDAYTAVTKSRSNRDQLLYKENTGLVNVAFGVKKYVKSIYGGTSDEFTQVSAIEFTNLKKKRK